MQSRAPPPPSLFVLRASVRARGQAKGRAEGSVSGEIGGDQIGGMARQRSICPDGGVGRKEGRYEASPPDLRCHLPPSAAVAISSQALSLPSSLATATAPYKFHPAASDANALTDGGRRTRLRIRSIHPLAARARAQPPPSAPPPPGYLVPVCLA